MINPAALFNFSPEQKAKNAEHEVLCTWQVPAHLPYFDGHFPEGPVLPGVALLDLFQVLLSGRIHFIKSTKFTGLVRPLDQLTISAKHNPETDLWAIKVSTAAQEVCRASIQFT